MQPTDVVALISILALTAPFVAVIRWWWERRANQTKKDRHWAAAELSDSIAEAARDILAQANQTTVETRTTAEGEVTPSTVTPDQIRALDAKLDQVNAQLSAIPAVLASHDATRDRSWRPSRSDWLLFALSLVLGLIGSFVLGILTAIAFGA